MMAVKLINQEIRKNRTINVGMSMNILKLMKLLALRLYLDAKIIENYWKLKKYIFCTTYYILVVPHVSSSQFHEVLNLSKKTEFY